MGNTELTYDIVLAAGQGNKQAQEIILGHYDSYLNALTAAEITDSEGKSRKFIDEDVKAEIQMKYLEAIPKCKVISE